MELWPEHQRGDAIAAAQCLSSYVDGLQELQRCVPTSSLWTASCTPRNSTRHIVTEVVLEGAADTHKSKYYSNHNNL
eukprot:3046144-Amphidinium_carterae.1